LADNIAWLSGLITTHDLDFGDLAEKSPEMAENYSFNSQIIEGELIFDYKISQGVCHSFSASKLMERIGIQVEEE
jgi:Mismatch repair ATPase (MutS family)